jgi:hypothetical protein
MFRDLANGRASGAATQGSRLQEAAKWAAE